MGTLNNKNMSYLEKLKPLGPATAGPQAQGPATPPAPTGPVPAYQSKLKPTATPAPKAPAPSSDVKGGLAGEILTGNTQRFGKTIGESIAAPENAQKYADVMEGYTKTQNDLLKVIKTKKAAGQDTTKLEEALHQHTLEAPKLEDFTGDVINKTPGQVAGEALGTALEIAPFATFGEASKVPTAVEAGKTLLTEPAKFLTKQGAKQAAEGAAFGYGVDVSQGLQNKEGAGAFKPGVGTAIGAVAPVALKTAGKLFSKGAEKVTTTIADRAAKAAGEADHLIGTIVQGEAKDIPHAQKAFQEIETKGIRTYGELKDALNAKVKTGSEKLREALGHEPYVKPLDELALKSKVGGVDISHNFVTDAIDQLESLYKKTANFDKAAEMDQLRRKAMTEGITVQEINDLAIKHGQDLTGFNANGELASGLGKQAAENTRKGLKQTAREQFNSKVYDKTDESLSHLIKTRDLVQEMEDKVQQLKQKTKDASLGERIGTLVGQILNFTTFGISRGVLQSGRDLGLFKGQTVLNAIDLEKRLADNLKRLTEITDKPLSENQMINRLESFLKENRITPEKPKKESLAPKPTKLAKNKGSSNVGALGATALGLGAVTGLMTPSVTNYQAPPAPAPTVQQELAPAKIADALSTLESSGGTNKASADPGEKRWITGLTRVAVKELKRLKLLDNTFNENNVKEVKDASVKYFKYLQQKHPDKTPAEIYVDHYWTQAKNDSQRQKKIDEFNNLIK